MRTASSVAAFLLLCVIAFGTEGVPVRVQTEATTTLYCCGVYGNVDGDYVDAILGEDGTNGNFSADPMFCNVLIHYLRLTESSPCTQENAGACGLIGAFWENCSPTTGDFIESKKMILLR